MKIEQEYELVALNGDEDVIKPHPDNPNEGDDEVVEESVDENGWYGAITAQRSTGYILAGHTRWRVAMKKGATEIPVIWRDVDDETALKMMLADNQTARRAQMNEAKLEALLQGLDTLTGTGYVLASAQEQLETKADSPTEEPEFANDFGDDIPDDVYTPQYGVMIVCEDEEHQEEIYRMLSDIPSEHPIFGRAKLQVVAV